MIMYFYENYGDEEVTISFDSPKPYFPYLI